MSHFKRIYASGGAAYDALVSREDYQGNILRHIQQLCPLDGLDVVEIGAGTGRISALVAPHVRSLTITDSSAHMLSFATKKLQAAGHAHWSTQVAAGRRLPLKNGCADLVLAGWVFGHATEWRANDWHTEISAALAEMTRVLRPGGTAIILETMGTGTDRPAPPNDALAAYYDWLQGEQGFKSAAFRTDYEFATVAEGEQLTRAFFGDALADRVRDEGLRVLPECTGVWWKRV